MGAKHTPGPWAWFGNARTREIYLATTHSGRRYVMGFRRWGMRGAQPIFQPGAGSLVPAEKLLTFEVGDRDVRGLEAARANDSVYRFDIRGIDCADAHLIAAAPDLLGADDTALALVNDLIAGIGITDDRLREVGGKLAAAIAKAKGGAE